MAAFDRPLEDPLVEKLLVAAILRINSEVKTEAQAKLAVAALRTTMSHLDKLTANRKTIDLLRDGAKVVLNPGETAKTVHFIAFDQEQQHFNDFTATNQYRVQGVKQCREDTVLVVNGIPLVIAEYKSYVASAKDWREAVHQLHRYQRQPRLSSRRTCSAWWRTRTSSATEPSCSKNPHKLLASYAKDLDIVVFNGHVHTTELYEVDGIKYLLLGGGGAEQDPILPGRTHIKVPPDYPPDLYWKGQPPKEEYNYVLVDVEPGQQTKFTLSRFRPWSAQPFETVELFNTSK